ncbi:MSCRAMM family protein [Actinoplanes sp. RD1]|uniref:MSCRAMM family protein n=1 Tax=Actinoplanes sp. RD1 TaxID=3064538 RepID=UPI002741B54E|nr:carboxypeptidase-like regulatory domain-containing protein [Actinoplanes sp. RD1]
MKSARKLLSMVAATVLAGATAMTAGAAPVFAQERSGSLAGSVHDTRGAAVSGAMITVYPADLSGSEVAQTTTGTGGRFEVPALQPGGYRLLIDREGWSEWAPGRITDPARAAVYRIRPARTTVATSVVTAFGVLAGRVTTAAGRPAPGIRVSVTDLTASEWDVTTAADGTYAMTVPPQEGYVVGFTNGHVTQYSPQTLEWAQARRYPVSAGRTTRVDEQLIAPAVLTGRLLGLTGHPVAGARVHVEILMIAGVAETTTAADGTYQVDGLPPGDVKVEFITPGGQVQWAYQKESSRLADRIPLVLGTVTTVDDTLVPPTPPGAVAGRVTTATGEPAAGITVTVLDPTIESWDTTTAADGTYSLSLPAGTGYLVSFTNGELTQYAPHTLDRDQAGRYTVAPGATTRIDEQLFTPAVLTGRLLDANGTPVAGAAVSVDILATASVAETTTGPDGTYRIGAMAAGEVVVGFTSPDGRRQWAYRKTSFDTADHITLTLGTVTTVDDTLLPAVARVAGRALAPMPDRHPPMRCARLDPWSRA